ncbi:MAG TPA: LysM peptidoglycan-binding domain-containing protein [Bacteroidales bacterium]|nr:LysM peptidoglycan-binding domain-containing protein [Bacteroidales bacterium]
MSKRLIFLLLIVFACSVNGFCQIKGVPTVILFEKTYYKYEVKAKETIYSLCKRFNTTPEELQSLNPTVSAGLKKGQVLLIPAHDLEKKEADQVVVAPLIKSNDTTVRTAMGSEKRKNTLFISTDRPRITVLLPFAPTNVAGSNERYIEFYEGLLLAVDSLKSLGLSFEVQALECGHDAATISKLIDNGQLDETDYCIGGTTPEQISLLSEWAKKNHRYLIFPFSSRIPEMESNPYLFQTNTPHLYMFDRLADYAAQRVGDTNVIFLKASTDESDIRAQLIPRVQAKFKRLGIPYIEVADDENLELLSKALSETKLNQIMPTPLNMQETNNLLTRLGAFHKANPNFQMVLVGYPDWMAINKGYQKYLYDLNTIIYSNFYADTQQKNVRDFQILFNQTYDQNLMNTYPKYGMMGYDIAGYFIPRMVFEKSEVSDTVRYLSPLQSEFKFGTTNALSGASNQSFFIIRYTPENEVEVKVMH